MLGCLVLFIVSLVLQIWGAYAQVDFTVFMWLNLFGSIAYGAWMTAPPVVIAAWFPNEKRGLPNSISATWISFGMMLVLTFSMPLVGLSGDDPMGWINIWWGILILMCIGFVLVLIFGRMPKAEESFMETAESTGEKVSMADGLKNSGVWMLIIMFLTFGFATAAFGNYFPTYLNADPSMGGFGIDLTEANGYTSISSWVMIVTGFVWGFVLNAVPNKHYDKLNLVVIILTAACGVTMFILPSTGFIVAFMVIWGIISRTYPPVCFTILPEITKSQEECSVATGILSVVSNLIGTAATSICGMCAAVSWNTIWIPSAIFAVLGIVAGVLLIPIYQKKFAERHANDALAA